MGSWPGPAGESKGFPRNGSRGYHDAKKSRRRSGIYKLLVADGRGDKMETEQ